MRKIMLFLVLSAILCGCGGETSEQSNEKAPISVEIDTPDREIITVEDQTPDEEPEEDIEPCFLSPCDCNCYVQGHIPLSAKKSICGLDCKEEYGIKGCQYNGRKCVKID